MNITELGIKSGLLHPAQQQDANREKALERFAALIRAEYEAPLKLAEEAIEQRYECHTLMQKEVKALAAIRAALAVERSEEALAEPVKQEPVASVEDWVARPHPEDIKRLNEERVIGHWNSRMNDIQWREGLVNADFQDGQLFYAAPVQPVQQEPVAYWDSHLCNVRWAGRFVNTDLYDGQPLYAAPVQPVKQEPVAWLYRGHVHDSDPSEWAKEEVFPLYMEPVDAKAIRAEALEEAAKMCKNIANSQFKSGEYEIAGVLDHCAAAIRSLK